MALFEFRLNWTISPKRLEDPNKSTSLDIVSYSLILFLRDLEMGLESRLTESDQSNNRTLKIVIFEIREITKLILELAEPL